MTEIGLTRFDDAAEPETRAGQQFCIFGAGTLLAGGGDQHLQIEHHPEMRRSPLGQHHFQQQKLPSEGIAVRTLCRMRSALSSSQSWMIDFST